MCTSSTSTIIQRCCYVLLVLFITSSCAYVIDSDDLKNSLNEHQLDLNIRATKFPRIGRSSLDSEEIDSIDDENEDRLLEQRSVLFPRIGKRAFHNIVWGNSLTNPHRMLDGQGRYHIDGYGYYFHPNSIQSTKTIRGKRNISM